MNITNTHTGPLGLPGGQELPPNVATPVHDWDTIKQNAVVSGWLKAGILVEGKAAPKTADPADRDELVAKLAALGVKHHPNTGIAKLQALLVEAEADALAERNRKAFEASGLTVEAWDALPEDERLAAIAKLSEEQG